MIDFCALSPWFVLIFGLFCVFAPILVAANAFVRRLCKPSPSRITAIASRYRVRYGASAATMAREHLRGARLCDDPAQIACLRQVVAALEERR
ncbi:MAG: hypothetical protein JK586_04665 [Nocardiopsis sp. BM-2018]|nr:MAG: hypothetical protein JK586_04665 [Nocardiopsis sp. BM-2018]